MRRETAVWRSLPRVVLCITVLAMLVSGAKAVEVPLPDYLQLHLDASQIDPDDTINEVRKVGSDVYLKRWYDQSAGHHDAVQSAEASQPMYIVDGLNGKPAVRFDGSDDLMSIADTADLESQSLTMFVVVQYDKTSGTQYVLQEGRQNSGWIQGYVMRLAGATQTFQAAEDSTTWATASTPAGAMQKETAYVLAGRVDDSADKVELYVDGMLQSATATIVDIPYTSNYGLTIGAAFDGTVPFDGAIAEILIYDKALTWSEHNEVGWYLKTKYSLANAVYVPEPSSLVLLGAGLMLLGVGVRFAKRKKPVE